MKRLIMRVVMIRRGRAGRRARWTRAMMMTMVMIFSGRAMSRSRNPNLCFNNKVSSRHDVFPFVGISMPSYFPQIRWDPSSPQF